MDCEQIVIIVAAVLFFMILINLCTPSKKYIPDDYSNEYYAPPQLPFIKQHIRVVPMDNPYECMARCQTNKDVAELLRNGSNASECIMKCLNSK